MARPKGTSTKDKLAPVQTNQILAKARTTLDERFDPKNVTGHVPGVLVMQPRKGPLDVFRKRLADQRARKAQGTQPDPTVEVPESLVFVSEDEAGAKEIIEKELGETVDEPDAT